MLVEMQLHKALSAAFRFVVVVDGRPVGAFTECTPPTIEWEVEQLKEGGVNTFVRQLPGPRKPSNISLKNGIGIVSELLLWYRSAMNEKFSRRTVTITLLDSLMIPIMVWHIEDAFPLRWSVPQLQTDSNTAAVQSLELACGEITIL